MERERLRQQVGQGDRDAAQKLLVLAKRNGYVEDWRYAAKSLGSLDGVIAAGGLSAQQTWELLNHTLEELLHWHRRGNIHGQLTPAHLQIVSRNERQPLTVEVRAGGRTQLPFFARQIDPRVIDHVKPYLAPECFGEVGARGPDVDLYALGCIVHEMLVGSRLFRVGADVPPEQALQRSLSQLPQQDEPGLWSDLLKAFLSRTLAPPEQRLRDAREALELIRRPGMKSVYSADPAPSARLVYRDQTTGREQYFELSPHRPTLSIGRQPGNDLVVNDPSVSRQHAVIAYHNGLFTLEDAPQSKGVPVNGTSLNGHSKVFGQSMRLYNRDEIRCGRYPLFFVTRYAPPATQMEVPAVRSSANMSAVSVPSMPALAASSRPRHSQLWYIDPRTNAKEHIDIGPSCPMVIIGRSDDCTLSIPHASVSRYHAVIRYEKGVCKLNDPPNVTKPPTNGTRIENVPKVFQQEAVLTQDATLRFGHISMRFIKGEDAATHSSNHWAVVKLRKVNSELEAAQRGYAELQKREQGQREELSKMRKDLYKRDAELVELERRLQFYELSLSSLKEQITTQKTQGNQWKEQADTRRSAIENLKDELAELKQENEGLKERAESRKNKAKASNDQLQSLKVQVNLRDHQLKEAKKLLAEAEYDRGVEHDNAVRFEAVIKRLNENVEQLESQNKVLRGLLEDR